MMKRILTILLMVVMVFTISACQPTPETPIVVQKDLERMVESAEAGGQPYTIPEMQDESALRDALGAPETYANTVEKEHIKIELNAQVIVPDHSSMPIVRVEAADFSQETARQLFDALCGGAKMFDTTGRRTKAELEEEILSLTRLRESEDYADDSDGQREINDWIEAARREYETAPETREDAVVEGTLYMIPEMDPKGNRVSEYMGIRAQNEARDMGFSVDNNNGLTEPIIYEYGTGWSGVSAGSYATMMFSKKDPAIVNDGRWYCEPLVPITDESVVPAEALSRLTITPAQARALVEKVLAGTNMEIRDISLANDYYDWSEDPNLTKETATYGYFFNCTRTVNGVPVAITNATINSDDYYAPSWLYEYCQILITDAGIIDFIWRSPHEVKETVVENAALLPFEEIIAIAESMLAVSYPKAVPGGTPPKHTTVRIERMELALQRVSEQNNIKDGLYIPVWSCYGSTVLEYVDGDIYDSADQSYKMHAECLLTINAVDGSIIDLSKGY